jgi:hypothetical protein
MIQLTDARRIIDAADRWQDRRCHRYSGGSGEQDQAGASAF